MRNYSGKTLTSYRLWVRKFQGFVGSKAPGALDGGNVKAFLTDLAVRREVAASTQNQAFNALLFFFRQVLGREFGKLDGVVRAKRRPYVPVVLSRQEVDAVLEVLEPPFRLVAELLDGGGLRIGECLDLRIHCFNLDAMLLTVHDGKGRKDRTVPLPKLILPGIKAQFETLRKRHEADLAAGYDLQSIQRLLGHGDIKTTMIYLQTVPSVTLKQARSPLDFETATQDGGCRWPDRGDPRDPVPTP